MPPSRAHLAELRQLTLYQTRALAERMGLSLRPYQEPESKARSVRSRHVRLAESVARDMAIEKQNLELAPANVRKKAIKLALMLVQQNLKERSLSITKTFSEKSRNEKARPCLGGQ